MSKMSLGRSRGHTLPENQHLLCLDEVLGVVDEPVVAVVLLTQQPVGRVEL